MRRSLIWLAIATISLLSCQSALQPASAPTAPLPTVSAPTAEPDATPTTAPTHTPVPTATLKSGFAFTATIGPTCPGPQRVGQVCTAPYEGEFVVMRSDGSEAARFKTDVDGRAVIDLPPDDYTISVNPDSGSGLRRGGSIAVSVVAGQYVELTLDLDTGMR